MKVYISTHSRGYISYPVHKVFVSPARLLQWALYLHKCGKAFSSFFLLSLLQSYKPVSICTLRLRLPLPRASFSGVSFWLTFSSMMLYQQMTQVAQPSSLRYSLGITFCTSFCCVAFSPQLAPPSLPAPPFFPFLFIFLFSFCSSSPTISFFFFPFFFLLLLFMLQWVGQVSNSYLGHHRQVLYHWSPFSFPKLSQTFLSFRVGVWARKPEIQDSFTRI